MLECSRSQGAVRLASTEHCKAAEAILAASTYNEIVTY
jgi:hypothetical protein